MSHRFAETAAASLQGVASERTLAAVGSRMDAVCADRMHRQNAPAFATELVGAFLDDAIVVFCHLLKCFLLSKEPFASQPICQSGAVLRVTEKQQVCVCQDRVSLDGRVVSFTRRARCALWACAHAQCFHPRPRTPDGDQCSR